MTKTAALVFLLTACASPPPRSCADVRTQSELGLVGVSTSVVVLGVAAADPTQERDSPGARKARRGVELAAVLTTIAGAVVIDSAARDAQFCQEDPSP